MTLPPNGRLAFKYNLSKKNAKKYGARGGAKTGNYRFLVEGEHLTYTEIGLRLGVTSDTAAIRMKRCLNADQTPTWELLGLQI
jgi:hypothetical protein